MKNKFFKFYQLRFSQVLAIKLFWSKTITKVKTLQMLELMCHLNDYSCVKSDNQLMWRESKFSF